MHRAAHEAAGREVAHVHVDGRAGRAAHLRHPDLLDLGLLQPLRLRAPVLEPDLHLRLGQPQRRRELGPLGDAQVLLLAELLLQRQQLRLRTGSGRKERDL